ncbi:MAG: HAD family hydrolase [Pyrinomonadaceae bacterium]|nr:HAD family hydrolase [Phycisphaerales bacterium]
MPRAVFLDRDDTLIANREVTACTGHPGDLYDPALVKLLPGVAEACSELKERGYLLIVVSNQGAVARGRCTVAQVEACNARMALLLKEQEGVTLDGVYFCPHHPAGTVAPYNAEHPWRKPGPGMLLQAARDLDVDLSQSWMIGDAPRDIEAALAAGIPRERAMLIGDAGGGEREARIPDMPAAARLIT